ncbi:MAG: ATP-binding protein [Vulcanimicrobiaceae bacterium]|jgi:signal transduction histidine kinase/CheY-like chemotaxis protein
MSADRGRRAGVPGSLSTFPSSQRQRLLAGGVAAVLTAFALAALPHVKDDLPEVPAFVAATVALIAAIDLITAYLLFRDAAASRSRSVVVLACGYLFTGLIVIPYGLVFPENWTPPGVLHGSEPAAWLYSLWHFSFVLVAIAYVTLMVREDHATPRERPLTVWAWAVGTVGLVAFAVAFALVAASIAPPMEQGRTYHPLVLTTVPLVVGVFVISAGLITVLVRRGTVVPLWLAVTCCGFALEVALTLVAGARYTVGWYLARVIALIASSAVLGSLLFESGKLLQVISDGERRLRRVVDGVGDALLALDDDGRIVDANPAACAVFGLAADELRGKDSASIVASSAVPLDVGVGEGVLIARDVTEQRRAAEAAEEAIAQARESAAAKTRFLATMSHELRTPINAVVGLSELILETPLTDEARDYANTVRDSAEALVSVINDILDFSKIEAGATELEREPFSPRSAVEVVARILAPSARVKNVALVTDVAGDVPPQVLGDVHRLRQVLMNLTGNAVKFTEHGSVWVHVSVERFIDERSAMVQFSIVDTGPGIAPELAAHLFEPFRQADAATTRRFGGTGLGLSISSRIVELMGGKIVVESVVGVGTTFRFSIPLERVTAAQRAPVDVVAERSTPVVESKGPTAGRPFAVLIVDDNAVNRKLTLQQLKKLGYGDDAETAENGREAIEAVARRSFDLVLMDCEMPEVDGFTATRAIREAEALTGTHVTIVAMTANAMAGDREACLAVGMDGYLAKPVQLADLRGAIERHAHAPA